MIKITSTNLARAFHVFFFEGWPTSGFTATVILTVQKTLSKSLTGLTQASIQVIFVRIVLKMILLIFDNFESKIFNLHCRSKLGCRILYNHQCNPDGMDKLNTQPGKCSISIMYSDYTRYLPSPQVTAARLHSIRQSDELQVDTQSK